MPQTSQPTDADGGENTPLQRCVLWFREQQRALYAFSQIQANGALEAEELLSESLKRVASAVARGLVPPVPERLTPYALHVIRNTAIDTKRRNVRRSLGEGGFAGGQQSAVDFERASDAQEKREESNRAMALLRALPRAQAEVVLLRLWQQLSFVDIGEALGIPPTTAQSRYHAALAQLRTQFYQQEHE